MPQNRMSQAEFRLLRDLSERRFQLTTTQAAARKADILADWEVKSSAEYAAEDFGMAEVLKLANARIAEVEALVNADITRECDARGIPPHFRPHWYAQPFGDYWSRRGENARAERRAELRKLAERAATAEEKQAVVQARTGHLEYLEMLTLGQLTSYEARRMLEAMPKAADLMPPLSVKGVERMAAALGARTPEERARLVAGTEMLRLLAEPPATDAPEEAAD